MGGGEEGSRNIIARMFSNRKAFKMFVLYARPLFPGVLIRRDLEMPNRNVVVIVVFGGGVGLG